MMPEVHDEIAELEAEIEAMARSAELCRSIIRAAKMAAVAGGVSLLIAVTGLLALPTLGYLLGVGAVFGGIVVAGSNKGTLDELAESIRTHEARRAELIDGMELQAVGENPALTERR